MKRRMRKADKCKKRIKREKDTGKQKLKVFNATAEL
jgi:hypothetical protein